MGNVGNRESSIDWVKAYACFSVVAIHFRLNIQENYETFSPVVSIIMSGIYQIFVSCVPLFLICTGFLMTSKTYNSKFYLYILKILTLYILCSVFTIIILRYSNDVQESLLKQLSNILFFKTIDYSWYVEMFIGLSLLIPTLNILIKKGTKSDLKKIIIFLILITGFPPIVNSNPILNKYVHLPSYWINIYPCTYYILGGYVKKYIDLNEFYIKHKKNILFMYFSSLIIGFLINVFMNPNGTGAAEGYYGSIIVIVQSVCLFIVISYNCKSNNRLILLVSQSTLSIYLMSFIVDKLVYPRVINLLIYPKYVILAAPIITMLIFFTSVVLGKIIDFINKLLWKKFNFKS